MTSQHPTTTNIDPNPSSDQVLLAAEYQSSASLARTQPKITNVEVFTETSSRGDVINHLRQQTAKGPSDIPLIIYRSDLLPDWRYGFSLAEASRAALYVDFSESYATFADGLPIWSRMPHEPPKIFDMFAKYLEQLELQGARQTFMLASADHSPKEVRDLANEFYWVTRARAYDIYKEASYQKHRALLTKKTENVHFERAAAIMQKVMREIDGGDDGNRDIWSEMSGKDLINAVEQMMKVQRMSLGLSAQGGSPTNLQQNPGSSFEAVFRTISQAAATGAENNASTVDRLKNLFDGDNSVAMAAQEIILKMNNAGSVRQHNVDV